MCGSDALLAKDLLKRLMACVCVCVRACACEEMIAYVQRWNTYTQTKQNRKRKRNKGEKPVKRCETTRRTGRAQKLHLAG